MSNTLGTAGGGSDGSAGNVTDDGSGNVTFVININSSSSNNESVDPNNPMFTMSKRDLQKLLHSANEQGYKHALKKFKRQMESVKREVSDFRIDLNENKGLVGNALNGVILLQGQMHQHLTNYHGENDGNNDGGRGPGGGGGGDGGHGGGGPGNGGEGGGGPGDGSDGGDDDSSNGGGGGGGSDINPVMMEARRNWALYNASVNGHGRNDLGRKSHQARPAVRIKQTARKESYRMARNRHTPTNVASNPMASRRTFRPGPTALRRIVGGTAVGVPPAPVRPIQLANGRSNSADSWNPRPRPSLLAAIQRRAEALEAESNNQLALVPPPGPEIPVPTPHDAENNETADNDDEEYDLD